jgi:heterodisulfide reductase subunit A
MDVGRHPRITLYAYSEVQEVNGSAGEFDVKVLRKARFVNEKECNACGECVEVCRVVVPSEYQMGLCVRHAIYMPFPQAVPSAYIVDPKHAQSKFRIACRKCVDACKKQAVDLDMRDEMVDIRVGSIIVATGMEYYDPGEASQYGYTRFENVMSSLELERMLSSGGPTGGDLFRFTDRRPPKTVAFIQCVGSRSSQHGIHYCSRICCMNATKSALVIREHFPDAVIKIFYIDNRAYGKGLEEFYRRALDEHRIEYVHGKPSKVIMDPETKDTTVLYEDAMTGRIDRFPADLVVLASALVPCLGSREFGKMLGIETDVDGFFKQKDPCAYPLNSTREGIYLAGCAISPKDITDSIVEASAAAVKAATHVEPVVDIASEEEEKVEPIDVTGTPRIGVFVCSCGSNIGGVLDVEDLRQYAASLPDVMWSESMMFSCAALSQEDIQKRIAEHKLNRVVVAACSPRTHAPIFMETIAKVGLNPYLLDLVNIRDQCSWVHQHEVEAAQAKAKDLIRMSVARARRLEPLEHLTLEINRDVLVIGGGVAGMQTAIDLKMRGRDVTLIEKEENLGGRVSKLANIYPSFKPGSYLIEQLVQQLDEVGANILTSTEVDDISGFVGNFEVRLRATGKRKKRYKPLKVGAIVLAVGSELYNPKGEYGFGKYPNVYTNMDFENLMVKGEGPFAGGKSPKRVAFIQCVGSRREDANPGCSRYCCQAAIKQAIALRERGTDVVILQRDVRVYSRGAEEMYRRARELGVVFLRYELSNLPKVEGKNKADSVTIFQLQLKTDLTFSVDAVVLSTGMAPNKQVFDQLGDLTKVQRGADGFFMERHSKFGPVETSMEGIFLAGCAQGPKDIADSIAQAGAVGAKISALLSGETITLEPIVSEVVDAYCRSCGRCVEVCEFHAISMSDVGAVVNRALCKGCGTCASICPTGAIVARHFNDQQIEAQLEAFLVG